MFKKLVASGLALFLILPVLSGCGAANASATSLVPGTANAVVQIQVAKLIGNPALRIAYDELARTRTGWPQTVDAVLAELSEKTGLDAAGVSTAVMFTDIESAGPAGEAYAGIIANGSFDEPAIIAKIQQQTQHTMTTSDYKGLTVYAGGKDKIEMAFFGPGRLVLGTGKAVRDTIDVSRGDQKPLTGIIIDTLDRFSAVLVAGAFAPPQSLRDQIGEGAPGQLPLSLNTFQSIDTVGFSVDLPGLTLNTRLDAHFSNVASVKDARDAVAGLISLTRATTQDPNLKAALGTIQVTAADSWLSLRGAAGLAEISTLIGSMPAPK